MSNLDQDSHMRSEELTPVKVRQGTGPRTMLVVLTVSVALAALVGAALLAYFVA